MEIEKGCIPLLFVNYIRTAPEYGATTFEIGTFSRKFVFRAHTEEHAKQWLLRMHCSIAQVFTPASWFCTTFVNNSFGSVVIQIVEDMVSPQNKLNRQKLAKVPKWWKHGRYLAVLAPQPSTPFDDSGPNEEAFPTHIPIHTSFHQVIGIARCLSSDMKMTPSQQRAAGGLHVDAVLGFTQGQVFQLPCGVGLMFDLCCAAGDHGRRTYSSDGC